MHLKSLFYNTFSSFKCRITKIYKIYKKNMLYIMYVPQQTNTIHSLCLALNFWQGEWIIVVACVMICATVGAK